MKYRQLALVGVLLVAVAIVARLTPEPILKLANTPEPTTIDELRRGDRIKKLKACSVPSVARGDGWIRLRGPDDFFEIDLPTNWFMEKVDSSPGFFPDPRTTFKSAKGDRILITRRANGSIGMSTFHNESGPIKPRLECEISDVKAGVLLFFYSPTPTPGRAIRFHTLGDGVTARGKRYGIELAAGSAADMDTLAALVSDAILVGRHD